MTVLERLRLALALAAVRREERTNGARLTRLCDDAAEAARLTRRWLQAKRSKP